MIMSKSDLALDGGPKTVTTPIGDRWQTVTPLEKRFVNEVLDDLGKSYSQLDKFEAEFRSFVGTKHALSMCNGTATIHSAVFAAGARAGREVIVPSVTWHASITPILHCGATPVFCEVDPETFCADPEDVKRRITDRTCAIIVTHVYGNPANMDAFLDIVKGTKIKLIEDASHAHGGMWDGKPLGSVGHIGCFSLQQSKAVTGIEAGVAVTNDDELYDRMLALGHYGRCEKLWATEKFKALRGMGLGIKYRANPMGIAMARAQLERLPGLNEKRQAWFGKLNRLLEGVRGIRPQKVYPKATRGGLLLYTGTINPEEVGAPVSAVLKALVAEGVGTQPGITPFGYGVMHLEPLFNDFPLEDLGGPWADHADGRRKMERGSLPVSERVHDTCFWLSTPVDPNPEWVEQVAVAFKKVVDNAGRLAEVAKEG
ncbi:MAG: DegT/DnrJ/EryC1/StrS family aminotransferase [Candidatus Latescibacteria bacterium]|nr:DegT/DnrJ/EryC1/StrS family aminotransferase [Candidatus Latescibacterota bacterium]